MHVYTLSRKLIQYSAVATSHNYMFFLKECPIPISSIPIMTLTLQLHVYQKLNEIRQKLLINKDIFQKYDVLR